MDPQMTVPEAAALADWVELHDRNLTTIYITHGHGDHYLGLPVALDWFPDARAAATTRTVAHMQQPGVPAQACKLGRRSAAGFASPPGLARHHRRQANEITAGMVENTARDWAMYQALKASDEIAAALQTQLIEEHRASRSAPLRGARPQTRASSCGRLASASAKDCERLRPTTSPSPTRSRCAATDPGLRHSTGGCGRREHMAGVARSCN
ncbi:MAG TPA: MBL fold metallo-hydrolase [Streptosporangiaceae bacterium]|nr:MBL fold metallo-hydrolase [Streptosporangiaceae bacterium]